VEYLRRKQWVVETTAKPPQDQSDVEEVDVPEPVLRPGPKLHILFTSSYENSQDGPIADTGVTPIAEDDDDDDNKEQARNGRSDYVGRANVQAVRAARKRAGHSEGFPRTDPLLTEFQEFLNYREQQRKTQTTK